VKSIKSLCWNLIGKHLFSLSPHNGYPYRAFILKCFGLKAGKRIRIRRDVQFDKPWNVTLGDLVMIGDAAIINATAPIQIGKRCVVSQYSMLVTKKGDCKTKGETNEVSSIIIEDDCWIAADTLVLPGSHIEKGVVVGARSMVEGRLPGWSICTGEPAQRRTQRVLYGTS